MIKKEEKQKNKDKNDTEGYTNENNKKTIRIKKFN